MLRTLAALLLAAGLPLLGCASRTAEPAAREQSVKPGINEPYREPDVEQWVERFEGESREIFRERERIVADLGLRPGDDVADVGAGTGLFTVLFAEAVGPTGRVYAVDISEEFIEHIRRRAAQAGLANIRGVVCAEDSVDLPAESVDLVFVCDTYHHFEYPRGTLASIHRALRPGGRLVVIDFIREEGVSREWVLEHVRAGQAVFAAEIEAAGFERVADHPQRARLEENYVMWFRKPGRR